MLDNILPKIKKWFDIRNLNHAVVGFSGGIDSATTAALLSRAGIPVTLVLALAPNQKRESDYNPYYFASLYENMDVRVVNFDMPTYYSPEAMNGLFDMNGVEKEAALPIIRNAIFYAVVAGIRSLGHNSIVVGTANFDEAAYLGFWGKASDAAQDFYPISHLHKSEVRLLAMELKVPDEILDATPSGDLLYSGDLNDFKMIGCDYHTVQVIAELAEDGNVNGIVDVISKLPNRSVFMLNILRNSFKYDIPFGSNHLNGRLEYFRKHGYKNIISAIEIILGND